MRNLAMQYTLCTVVLALSTPNLVVLRDTNFFPPIDRGVQSESIQYNRVGSKDLNFGRYDQKQYFPLILNGESGHAIYTGYRCLTTEYAKFGRSEGHQFFSTNR